MLPLEKENNKSHVLKHLHFNTGYFELFNPLSLKITDKAKNNFDLTKKRLCILIGRNQT